MGGRAMLDQAAHSRHFLTPSTSEGGSGALAELGLSSAAGRGRGAWGFVWDMVRSIVGTLIDVGTGKTSYDQFIDIINSKNRCNAGASAPAKGLFLSRIDYPKNLFV